MRRIPRLDHNQKVIGWIEIPDSVLAAAAARSWQQQAADAIRQIAQSQATLTSEDVVAKVGRAAEPRQMGAALHQAVDAGVIVFAGRYTRSQDGTSRGLAVWRSCLLN